MIYFIQAVDGGPIKIGTTIKLSQRLKNLCKEVGQDLRVLAVTSGDRNVERSLHQRFSHLRLVNEWFEPGDELLGFIVEAGGAWDGGDEDDLRSILSLKGSAELEEWLDSVVKATESGTRTNALKRALRLFASQHGVKPTMPER